MQEPKHTKHRNKDTQARMPKHTCPSTHAPAPVLPEVGIYPHRGDFEGFGGDHFFQVGIEIFKMRQSFSKIVGVFCKILGFFSNIVGFLKKVGKL